MKVRSVLAALAMFAPLVACQSGLQSSAGVQVRVINDRPEITGTADNDRLISKYPDSFLFGRAGDDTLRSLGVDAILHGDEGDDRYIYSAGSWTYGIYDIDGENTLEIDLPISINDLHVKEALKFYVITFPSLARAPRRLGADDDRQISVQKVNGVLSTQTVEVGGKRYRLEDLPRERLPVD